MATIQLVQRLVDFFRTGEDHVLTSIVFSLPDRLSVSELHRFTSTIVAEVVKPEVKALFRETGLADYADLRVRTYMSRDEKYGFYLTTLQFRLKINLRQL
jgi:hypothetical protein